MADRKPEHALSEATQRTFERAVSILKTKLDKKRHGALEALLREGRFDDIEAIVAVLSRPDEP